MTRGYCKIDSMASYLVSTDGLEVGLGIVVCVLSSSIVENSELVNM